MMETNRPSKNINNADAEFDIFAPFALANADVIYYNKESPEPRAQSPEPRAQSPEPRATIL
ncbi:MAG: hypothetical protein LBO82_00640 [Synergistaceae bacterium]|jgi:hypothetical protein|nr:hypothetical protein [Synergistaceae bacterium]